MNEIINASNKEEFEDYIRNGVTIQELQEIYSCSRSTITTAKKRLNLVGLSPNSKVRDNGDGTKICSTCSISKNISEFYSNGYTPSGNKKIKPSCKVCENTKRIERRNELFIDYLSSKGREYKCELCGYDTNYAALEFHHMQPGEKEFAISELSPSISKEKLYSLLDKELLKCAILCSNCHREFHNPLSFKARG